MGDKFTLVPEGWNCRVLGFDDGGIVVRKESADLWPGGDGIFHLLHDTHDMEFVRRCYPTTKHDREGKLIGIGMAKSSFYGSRVTFVVVGIDQPYPDSMLGDSYIVFRNLDYVEGSSISKYNDDCISNVRLDTEVIHYPREAVHA